MPIPLPERNFLCFQACLCPVYILCIRSEEKPRQIHSLAMQRGSVSSGPSVVSVLYLLHVADLISKNDYVVMGTYSVSSRLVNLLDTCS